MNMHELPAILECENEWVGKETCSNKISSAMARSQAEAMTDTVAWLSSLANSQSIMSHVDIANKLRHSNYLTLPRMHATAANSPFHQEEPISSGRKRTAVKPHQRLTSKFTRRWMTTDSAGKEKNPKPLEHIAQQRHIGSKSVTKKVGHTISLLTYHWRRRIEEPPTMPHLRLKYTN